MTAMCEYIYVDVSAILPSFLALSSFAVFLLFSYILLSLLWHSCYTKSCTLRRVFYCGMVNDAEFSVYLCMVDDTKLTIILPHNAASIYLLCVTV